MKKILSMLALAAGFFCCLNANAQYQNVDNAGFENWVDLSTSSVEPTHWNSFMTADATLLTSFGKKKRVDRSTVKRPGTTGSYSAVIWSTNEFGTIANGNLTTGKINMGSTSPSNSDNYNFTKTSDTLFCHPFTGHPDSLVVWVRFKPASNGTEQARINAVIHDSYNYFDPSGADANSPNHVVGTATLNFTKTNGAWVRKSIPFVYGGPSSTCAYVLISLTTNMTPGGGSAGDSLYVDDMQMVYNPSLTTGTIAPSTYFVGASTGTAISIPFTLTGTMYAGNTVTAQLSDASGSFTSPITLGSVTSTSSGTISGTIPASTPSGTGYRIRVVSTNYAITALNNGSDIQITLLTNSIAPSASQTIEAGTSGTATSVSEAIAATSREWKVGTTTGGPYVSFSPAETGVSYTPSFATAGDYYVVCVSTWAGPVVSSSNELHVLVADNSVSPSTPQTIVQSTNGTQMTVTETPTGASREWKYATVSGGPYTSFSPAETNTTYTPYFTIPATYYVVAQTVVNGVTITSPEVEITVSVNVGISDAEANATTLTWNNGLLNIDLSNSDMVKPHLLITDLSGRIVAYALLTSNSVNVLNVKVAPGIYSYSLQDGTHKLNGKILNK